ncbi:GvpL/GvpF family gas vesicle protein [Kribbella sp. NPDC026611]|uniref:GvpL/GvpF family gas vesicle protein n=1 Tax=Kribbella sp. NPDC026611 TaxID=3154911 RepID=UPI0033D3B0F9
MSERGSYIYAASRHVEDLEGLTGLRGAPLRAVRDRELAAIVSTVELDEFGEDPLRQHLEDLDWLEEVARGHDQVVRTIWSLTGAVAPFRLATICLNDEAVEARLTAQYDGLMEALSRVEGRGEWSVKAFLTQAAPITTVASANGSAGSGTAYLARRRQEIAGQQKAAEDAEALAEELHRQLAAAADACRRLPAQDRRLSGHAEPMVLNGAYLVADQDAELFRSAVDELGVRRPSVRLQVDGPWPPYSFTSLEPA